MTVRKSFYRQSIVLIAVSILVGCTATNSQSDFDQSLILVKDTPASETTPTGERLSFRIDGDKSFFDGPNSFFGGVFKLKLNLEDMQQKCAIRVFREKVDFSPNERNIKITSKIENFGWAVQNVGLLGQNAAVSFNLSVEVIRGQRKIHSNQTAVKDYVLDEAEFKSYQEIFLAPAVTAFTGKADKFALAAFMATTKHICEEYQKALTAASS